MFESGNRYNPRLVGTARDDHDLVIIIDLFKLRFVYRRAEEHIDPDLVESRYLLFKNVMGQPFARYAEFDLAAQFICCFINIDGMTFETELPGNTHSRRSSAYDSY